MGYKRGGGRRDERGVGKGYGKQVGGKKLARETRNGKGGIDG